MRLLLVEDEVRMATSLARGLEADGFRVRIVGDGVEALAAAEESDFDVILLDIMLPKLSGYEVLRSLRAAEDWTPVLMVSAKDGEYDLADALDLGADDYLVKPYSYVVLLARIRALLRRGARPRPVTLVHGGIELDPSRRSVTRDGAVVELTPREYDLLEYLMRHGDSAASRSDLLEQVFDFDPDHDTNMVEIYIGYLRRKLGRELIETVRGRGYRLARR